MDEKLVKDFLGVGWKFPVQIDEATGYEIGRAS